MLIYPKIILIKMYSKLRSLVPNYVYQRKNISQFILLNTSCIFLTVQQNLNGMYFFNNTPINFNVSNMFNSGSAVFNNRFFLALHLKLIKKIKTQNNFNSIYTKNKLNIKFELYQQNI